MMTCVRRLLGSFLVVAAMGCAAEDLEIVANAAPGVERCDGEPANTGDLGDGTFDLVIGDRDSYILTPRVANRSSAAITVDRADVRLEWDDGSGLQPLTVRCEGGELCGNWEQLDCTPSTCPVLPAGSETQIELRTFPRVVTAFFLQRFEEAVIEGRAPPIYDMVAYVTLHGTGAGGETVSPEFAFPITLCLGCLVDFPPETDDPLVDGPDCCAGEPPARVCLEGQDAPIDCRRCRSFYPELCNYGRPSCGG